MVMTRVNKPTCMGDKDHSSAQASEDSLFSKQLFSDVDFRFGIESAENIIKNDDARPSVHSACNRLVPSQQFFLN